MSCFWLQCIVCLVLSYMARAMLETSRFGPVLPRQYMYLRGAHVDVQFDKVFAALTSNTFSCHIALRESTEQNL